MKRPAACVTEAPVRAKGAYPIDHHHRVQEQRRHPLPSSESRDIRCDNAAVRPRTVASPLTTTRSMDGLPVAQQTSDNTMIRHGLMPDDGVIAGDRTRHIRVGHHGPGAPQPENHRRRSFELPAVSLARHTSQPSEHYCVACQRRVHHVHHLVERAVAVSAWTLSEADVAVLIKPRLPVRSVGAYPMDLHVAVHASS